MRDLVLLAFMLMYVPLGMTHAFAAYLLWGWAGLISLGDYMYGFMGGLPYAMVFALLTMFALVVRRDPQAAPFTINRTMVWMLVFVIHSFLCALLAYPDLVRNWELFGNIAKTVLFCAVMPMLVTSRLRIHAVVLMLAVAVSFHGALDGLKFIASTGGHNAQGLSKFGDNNHFALVLLMVIPLLVYLFHYSEKWFVRWAFAGVAILTVLAVVATHSRGGLVGLFAIAFWLVLKGRHKLAGIGAIILAGVLVVQLAPQDWSERMDTIQRADEDASFMGRVDAWKVSTAIAVGNPIFGGGFRAVQSAQVWERFKTAPGLLDFIETPPSSKVGSAAHSIWFEVLGDLGFVGFVLFVGLLLNAVMTRREILKLARNNPKQRQWAADLANLLVAVLLVYAVSGSLLSAAYFELPYVVMMLMEVVKLQLQREQRAQPCLSRAS